MPAGVLFLAVKSFPPLPQIHYDKDMGNRLRLYVRSPAFSPAIPFVRSGDFVSEGWG
ncbi:hypothetical protein B4135_3897 [Caldibacillus debilis]|uniref:Uncharacterized protein n=1 Tax=Caldibacillus debilis TaxID=301148 RepID=A0A150LAF4_9BACI|nr:hypothetical protein B4135_3897 [Caldibacillus debilis]